MAKILNRYGFLCIMFCCIQLGIGKEVLLTTSEGEQFTLTISPNETFEDLEEEILSLSDFNDKGSIWIEIPFDRKDQKIIPIAQGKNLKKHGQFMGQPRNYYANVSAQERHDIRFIVTFLANRSLITIASHRSSLEEAGDRIENVHPLRFLLTVFTDEEMKVGIRNIRSKGWIWSDFCGGLKESLTTEAKLENMKEEYILDFAKNVQLDPQVIRPSILGHRWDEFIDLLITSVPRKGDHSRYDS